MAPRTGSRLAALAVATVVLVASATACGKSDDDTAKGTGGDKTEQTTGSDSGKGDDAKTDATTTTVASNPNPDVPKVSDAEQAYVDALVSTYNESDSEIYTKTQIECLAARWVPIIGLGAFKDNGILPEDLAKDGSAMNNMKMSEKTARAMVAAMPKCGIDLVGSIVNGMMSGGATAEQKACVKDAVDLKAVEESMVRSFMGDDSENDDAFAGAEKCFKTEDTGSSASTSTTR